MVSTNDIRPGQSIIVDDVIYQIMEYAHVKPGKGKAFVKTKLKNIISGLTQEKSFRSGDMFQLPDLVTKNAQFLYSNNDTYTFMDLESFEQIEVAKNVVGDKSSFLKEELNVQLLNYESEIIGIDLPTSVELRISVTEPGLKGDTVTGGNKPAELETGAKISVPLFINIDDIIKVDTRDGKYLERIKKA